VSWIAVGVGAALGAWLRWGLGLWLNSAQAAMPFGTLAANLGGGFLIGLALAYFSGASVPTEWRLFVVTGILGGLTTFSTFSAESFLLLQRGDYLWALGHTALHLIGSLAMCAVGFAVWRTFN
jgi:CrcB protein